MRKWNKIIGFVFLLALVTSFIMNELNLEYIQGINPENKTWNTRSLVHNSTVWSIDNTSYSHFSQNLSEGHGYTMTSYDEEGRVRRTPVYPLFYFVFYHFLGEGTGHFIIRYVHLLLFALSAVLMMLTVRNFSKNEGWAKCAGILYAINPFIYSYNYFTLTEALTPTLVVLSLFFFSLFAKKQNKFNLFCSGLFVGAAFLCKPTSGIILVGLGAFLLFTNAHRFKWKVIYISILTAGFLSFISPWVIRNYLLRGEIIVAEKYYHGATMNFGRSHIEFRYLLSSWTNPANLSAEGLTASLIKNINEGNEAKNEEVIDRYLDQWPNYFFKTISRESLKEDLFAFASCHKEKEILKKNKPGVLRREYLNLPCEFEVFDRFKAKREKFSKELPFRYYVLTPLKTSKELVFNSFVHHFALFTSLRDQYPLLGLVVKSILFLLHVLMYASVFLFLLNKKESLALRFFIAAPVLVLMVALTALVFRYVESRYLLPIHPLMTITLAYYIFLSWNKINALRLKSK